MNELQQHKNTGEDYKKVIEVVKDFIFEKHTFPQVNDIIKITGIQKQRCNDVIDQLVRQKQLYVAFEGEGLPKIILLYDMMQGVLMTQKKPEWLDKRYAFSERTEISKKIEGLQKEAIRYEQFERLLYTADIPLEEAIAYTLDWLGFQNVIHHKDDPNNPDVTFEYDGVTALLEAEGTTKAGGKDKISQLDGWFQKALSQGAITSKLKGFFVVNHFRDVEPSVREDALTSHAKEFLRYYKFTYFETFFLYNITKRVVSKKLSTTDAQKLVWGGEKIS